MLHMCYAHHRIHVTQNSMMHVPQLITCENFLSISFFLLLEDTFENCPARMAFCDACNMTYYGVATVGRRLKIIHLFCRISSLL